MFGRLRVRILTSILSVLFVVYVHLSQSLQGTARVVSRAGYARTLSDTLTTVSSECMDVDIRDGGERTPSRSGYSSSAEYLVWTCLERELFSRFGK